MSLRMLTALGFLFGISVLPMAAGTGAAKVDSIVFTASNPLDLARPDEAISIPLSVLAKLRPGFDAATYGVYAGQTEIPSQLDDTNRDGAPDLLTFVTDFAPRERKELVLRWGGIPGPQKSFTKRTQADLSMKEGYTFVDGKYTKGYYTRIDSVRVPSVHVDHDALFQHEGPAWESDRVGYRFYLDARNRTDIYGKKVPEMVLQSAGVHDLVADNNESYESMLPWGMDNFKVGTSLGIGSVAMMTSKGVETVSWVDSEYCVIASNGPVRSEVQARYYGWKAGGGTYDLFSSYSITAGSRLTMCVESVTPSPSNLCTGIAKHEDTDLIEPRDTSGKGWKYLALYGKQSRAGDDMGIAVFYRGTDKLSRGADSVSEFVTLRPENGRVRYYFASTWVQELHGITSEGEFRAYLDEVTRRLDAPISLGF
ncbi:MAG TPA: DUF4861 domain-containing protein [Bacteroidota bacterium]|nr:DUF4861 domain-containing protein [Bacteroidota bacterium]